VKLEIEMLIEMKKKVEFKICSTNDLGQLDKRKNFIGVPGVWDLITTQVNIKEETTLRHVHLNQRV
jgi:hypothetical protein